MAARQETGVMVDFLWKEERLAVQIDGPNRQRRNPDEALADLILQNAGYRVLHLTEHEVIEEPSRIAELLKRELTRPNTPA